MNNLSSPLKLHPLKGKQKVSIPALPFFDILLIAFVLSLLSSNFISAPGLAVDLPSPSLVPLSGTHNTAVISVNHTNMIFFEGQIISPKNLLPILQKYIIEQPHASGHTLLAKISKNANIDTFFNICEVAKFAGFDQVNIASNTLHE